MKTLFKLPNSSIYKHVILFSVVIENIRIGHWNFNLFFKHYTFILFEDIKNGPQTAYQKYLGFNSYHILENNTTIAFCCRNTSQRHQFPGVFAGWNLPMECRQSCRSCSSWQSGRGGPSHIQRPTQTPNQHAVGGAVREAIVPQFQSTRKVYGYVIYTVEKWYHY